MATRKQRSRRAKTFRHDYALVVNDEEGNEVEVSSSALKGRTPEGETKAADKKTGAKASSSGGSTSRRGAPPKPSWERALKRGGLMGLGLAVLLIFFLHSPLVLAVVYAVLFIPLTYWMDRLTYNWWLKRQNPAPGKPPARKGR
jgi:hypothetical protein